MNEQAKKKTPMPDIVAAADARKKSGHATCECGSRLTRLPGDRWRHVGGDGGRGHLPTPS